MKILLGTGDRLQVLSIGVVLCVPVARNRAEAESSMRPSSPFIGGSGIIMIMDAYCL